MPGMVENDVEQAALAWFEGLRYEVRSGADLLSTPVERSDAGYRDVILERRLREALTRLNPDLPSEALDQAYRTVSRPAAPSLIELNRIVHRLLVDGVTVEYRRSDGSIAGAQARVLDFETPGNNDWLVVNQFTVATQHHTRRADVVLFVNGLPLAVFELKNAASEDADVWTAYQQLQTYQTQVPALFTYNAVLVASDGLQARVGVVGAGREWFKPWSTVTGRQPAPSTMPELRVVIEGVFEQRRLLDLIRFFVVFEDLGAGKLVKKMAGYHQFGAVNVAIEETLRATHDGAGRRMAEAPGRYSADPQPGGEPGDRRVGVIWHTQGSGKSLTMVFYAGRVIVHPEMANPTIVVLTDRNDLDDQLFGTFARCHELLRQPPVQVQSRAELRERLQVAGGSVVFTTIQKFFPEDGGDTFPTLSERRNIVVIADEAHRSQYGFEERVDPKTGERTYGFAKYLRDALPGASFIAFTGTPVELADRDTRAIFGDYINVYDIQRAVHDGATVPIYYESRIAKLSLDEAERPHIDPDFEEATEGEEIERKEKFKSKWAQLEAIVGAERRLKLIARDLIDHFENRLAAMDGKGMIVCMSRRICVDLYNEIVALRPEWHADPDDAGFVKVVMTGSAADRQAFLPHIRSKGRREALATRFRDPSTPFRLVIVRDMWLTGFDAPSLHTMYVDKPMRGHGLMQAIARVNRVFRDKPGGLVVDYLGLADELREALTIYTQSGGTGEPTRDQDDAVMALRQAYEVCTGLFYGFDRSAWITGTPADRLSLLPAAQDHILGLENGKSRLLDAVTQLTKAFKLAVPHEYALEIREDVGFFQVVRAVLTKGAPREQRPDEEIDYAIRQIVSRAMVSDEVLDIFTAAGLKKPDISILSDEFLFEVQGMPRKNLAVELLNKLLTGEVKARARHNVVQSRSFAEMLDHAVRRYQNKGVETAKVIEELIALARQMREANGRGQSLGLSEDELAFYDALAAHITAGEVLGDDTLRLIARELVMAVRKNVTIDWTLRENVQAQLRVIVKRILRRYGYPPDKQEKATQTVLEQAELFAGEWTS